MVQARYEVWLKGAPEPDIESGYKCEIFCTKQGGTAGNSISRPCHYDSGGSFFICSCAVVEDTCEINSRSEMQ